VSGATVLQATPATFRLLVEAGWRSNGHPLRTLSGGEALAPDLAAGLLERSTAVFNLYGPTETTIWSMAKRLSAEDGRVSLGKPIPGTRVYVLDSNLQPVPPGVTGEIAIAGEGVTRGYYGQPDRTAERFLPDPFAAEPGGRMYRTGDLARRRSDGEIEYLGRNDFQVKVRGFRIELGDIESALREIRGVRQAVVLAHGTAGASTRLVAYVVYEGAAAPTVTELRSALKEKLPLYMVPSSFVSVDALPLTPNGKVDRRALEKSEREEARGASHVEPRTAMERLVASIWRDVLERERVSLHDNFFDLGGHSLLSMKVVARLEDEIGERVNPRELIFQTLEQFAAACEAQSRRRVEVRPGLLGKVMDRLKSLAPRMQ
jgi:acyl-coenzyme A synthetase/AMP-(fatty) acid ligase